MLWPVVAAVAELLPLGVTLRMSKKLIIAVATGVFVIIAVTVGLAASRARATPAKNACLNNLRQMDGGKQQWALEYHKTTNDTPSWDAIRPYIGGGTQREILRCPRGGTYILGRVGELPRCTYRGHTLQ